MLEKPHPMGQPVEPRQWFVSIQDTLESSLVFRHPILQVRHDDPDEAVKIALNHHALTSRCDGRTWVVVLVRTKHKKLPVVIT